MTERNPSDGAEFLHNQFTQYFHTAKESLAQFYFDEAGRQAFEDNVKMTIVSDIEKGSVVPTCSYSGKTNSFLVKIETDTIEQASLEYGTDIDESPGDLLKLFVGAGVARSLLAWKTLPIKLDESDPRRLEVQETLFNKQPLLALADRIDPCGDYALKTSVERAGEDEVSKINTLRFVFGVSLQHMTDVTNWQQNLPIKFQDLLLLDQRQRILDLKSYIAILDNAQDAFNMYDDTVDHVLFGLSFPMSPVEELRSLL